MFAGKYRERVRERGMRERGWINIYMCLSRENVQTRHFLEQAFYSVMFQLQNQVANRAYKLAREHEKTPASVCRPGSLVMACRLPAVSLATMRGVIAALRWRALKSLLRIRASVAACNLHPEFPEL